MQSVLTRLRALHEEVCHCWRERQGLNISDGEAEVLNLGLHLLEAVVRDSYNEDKLSSFDLSDGAERLSRYVDRVHAQFDRDADIVIKGDR